MTTMSTPIGDGAEPELARRLLESSAVLSYEPNEEIDWDAPLPAGEYGCPPEWCTLYGTPLWDEMTEEQRVRLTRHEFASTMCTGIWFEMILQQMILRDQYAKDPTAAEFQFALTEIADECRHSLMFARTVEKLGAPAYYPTKGAIRLARFFKSLAKGEAAYGAGLVAEEVLDVLQRDQMSDPNVLQICRTTARVHVAEESRHMKFARAEVREHLSRASAGRRRHHATLIAIVAHIIVTNLVSDEVYATVGLDAKRAAAEARANPHRASLMRSSCAGLMEFLGEVGLLTRPAIAIYRHVNML